MIKRIATLLLMLITGLIRLLVLFLAASIIRYFPEFVFRALRWRESSVDTYRELFPAWAISAPV